MGGGSIISISKKQKLNTKIPTESELIKADNAMPQMIWTRYFWKRKDTVSTRMYYINAK